MPDFPRTWCVVAVPSVGVSTPAAFKAWDALVAEREVKGIRATADAGVLRSAQDDRVKGVQDLRVEDASEKRAEDCWTREAVDENTGHADNDVSLTGLTSLPQVDKLQELSLAYSSLFAKTEDGRPGTSGIVRDSNPEKKQGLSGENQNHAMNDLAENTLLALVRTGIGNDFEEVVFPQYPSLRITKRQLMGSDSDGSDVNRPAIYAALSGSGSALFGLYRSEAEAKAAQQRVQCSGVQALLTETLPRAEYWERMFAE
jgi:4-diphosphocytidyl-2-C-methyl-D-erythritol kinase